MASTIAIEALPETIDASDDEPQASDNTTKDENQESLSVAQRARIERNRLRARSLRDARLIQRPDRSVAPAAPAPDTGGGFLPEEPAEQAPPIRAPPAPVVDPAERPRCLECGRSFPQSHLFDSFGHRVCDECRSVRAKRRAPARRRRSPECSPQGRRRRARARDAHGGQGRVPAEGLRPGPARAGAALRAAPQPAQRALRRHAPVPARAGGGARAAGVGLGGGAAGGARAARRGARAPAARRHAEAPARAAHGRALESVRPHARRAPPRVRRRAVRRAARRVLAHVRLVRARRDLREDVTAGPTIKVAVSMTVLTFYCLTIFTKTKINNSGLELRRYCTDCHKISAVTVVYRRYKACFLKLLPTYVVIVVRIKCMESTAK